MITDKALFHKNCHCFLPSVHELRATFCPDVVQGSDLQSSFMTQMPLKLDDEKEFIRKSLQRRRKDHTDEQTNQTKTKCLVSARRPGVLANGMGVFIQMSHLSNSARSLIINSTREPWFLLIWLTDLSPMCQHPVSKMCWMVTEKKTTCILDLQR